MERNSFKTATAPGGVSKSELCDLNRGKTGEGAHGCVFLTRRTNVFCILRWAGVSLLPGEERDETKCGTTSTWHFLIQRAAIGKEICMRSAHVIFASGGE